MVPATWREGRLQQIILHLCKAKQENLRQIKWILVLISALTMSFPLVIFSLCLMTVLTQPWAGGRGPPCFLFPQNPLQGKPTTPSRLASSLFSALLTQHTRPSFVKHRFIRKGPFLRTIEHISTQWRCLLRGHPALSALTNSHSA